MAGLSIHMPLRAFLFLSLTLFTLFTPVQFKPKISFGTQASPSRPLDYLASQQADEGSIGGFATSAWVALAVRSAGQDPGGVDWAKSGTTLASYLQNNIQQLNLTSATDLERYALAMVAVGEDPSAVNGINLVAQLETLSSDGQIGNTALLNDDFWGVLALVAAGAGADEIVATSASSIKSHQNADGGWGWAVGVDSDPDDTAAAIQALLAAGVPAGDFSIFNALNYLRNLQATDGGVPSFGTVNSSTDAWVIQAIVAAGQDPDGQDWSRENGTLYQNLLTFQNGDGSFNWTNPNPDWADRVFTTALAVPAVAKQPNPIGRGYIIDMRIEGKTDTIWAGKVFVSSARITDDQGAVHFVPEPTVIGALAQVSTKAGFPFSVKSYSFGLFVNSINGETGSGASGWEFRVNWVVGQVGADAFVLQQTTPPDPPHTQILWHWSDWNTAGWTDNPLHITIDGTEFLQNQTINVNVSYFNGIGWVPADGATVEAAGSTYAADANGEAKLNIQDTGSYAIRAEKPGYVRSEQLQVNVSDSIVFTAYSQGTTTSLMTSTVTSRTTSTQSVTATNWQISPALTRTVVSLITVTSTQSSRITGSYKTLVQSTTITKTLEQQISGPLQAPGPTNFQYSPSSGLSLETFLLVILVVLLAFAVGRRKSDYF